MPSLRYAAALAVLLTAGVLASVALAWSNPGRHEGWGKHGPTVTVTTTSPSSTATTTVAVTTTAGATTTVEQATIVASSVPGPAGANGSPGTPGPQGPAGQTGAPGRAADVCPNIDGVQLRAPILHGHITVLTLNPRGQLVCVSLRQAQKWHPRPVGRKK